MAYASVADFEASFGADECLMLTQLDDACATEINYVLIERALDEATDEANGYLRGRYAVPVVDPPSQLRRWVMSIARYLLNRYNPPKVVVEDYERVLGMLRDVRKGALDLGLGSSNDTPTPVVGSPELIAGVGGVDLFADLGGF